MIPAKPGNGFIDPKYMDRLEALVEKDGYMPKIVNENKEAKTIARYFRRKGFSWDEAARLVGAKPYWEKEWDKGTSNVNLDDVFASRERVRARKEERDKLQLKRMRLKKERGVVYREIKTPVRFRSKTCEVCKWRDKNGYCPSPDGLCYKNSPERRYYGTFREEKEISQ